MSDLYYRYPLPAHTIPHIEEDCGDPEWCLHEEPSERADLQIELIPVPNATEPLVVFSPDVAAIGERLDVDTEGMSQYLQRRAGWTALDAAGIRISFMSREEFAETRKLPDQVEGVYRPGAIDRPAGDGDGSEEVHYQHSIAIPVSAGHVSVRGVRLLNSILRHELGHGDSGGRFGWTRLYHDALTGEDGIERSPGYEEPKLFGRIPASRIASIAESLGFSGLGVLHRLDKEENYARAFDRRHARGLNPISLKQD